MIRLAHSCDLTRLADIERSAAQRFLGTDMAWAVDGDTLPLDTLRQALAAGLLWVAVDGERLCGFALAMPLDGDLYLAEMSVAMPEQGRGLGRALMRAVLDHARQADRYRAVVLTTDLHLPWNAPFYRRLGFDVVAPSYSSGLQARLQAEAAAGFDSARRCAMAYPLAQRPVQP
ncbi:GNAT family N-acetyltransferase [Achromobacter sp. ES-001]|uniref:GNAT family N-acetyltransferase n=1 Tax=Achromobacter sp. ES-001 TaxID=2860286 RepID=UPI001C6430A7|nr:GNAT family N-acetyltransferase [Achromobacter sp. ES-001]QYJ23209.1 GNAT family N-acetyltransferase [Achromobacter sp. ES-001]